jgi:hypothetical protein
MKKPLILFAMFCFCLSVLAQEHEAEHKLLQFQMVLLKRGSKPMTAGFFTIEVHPWWSEDVFKKNGKSGLQLQIHPWLVPDGILP